MDEPVPAPLPEPDPGSDSDNEPFLKRKRRRSEAGTPSPEPRRTPELPAPKPVRELVPRRIGDPRDKGKGPAEKETEEIDWEEEERRVKEFREEEEKASLDVIIEDHLHEPPSSTAIEVGQHFCFYSYLNVPRVVVAAHVLRTDDIHPLFLQGHHTPIGPSHVEYPPFLLTYASEVGAYPNNLDLLEAAEKPEDRARVCIHEMCEMSGSNMVEIGSNGVAIVRAFERDFMAYIKSDTEYMLQSASKLMGAIKAAFDTRTTELDAGKSFQDELKGDSRLKFLFDSRVVQEDEVRKRQEKMKKREETSNRYNRLLKAQRKAKAQAVEARRRGQDSQAEEFEREAQRLGDEAEDVLEEERRGELTTEESQYGTFAERFAAAAPAAYTSMTKEDAWGAVAVVTYMIESINLNRKGMLESVARGEAQASTAASDDDFADAAVALLYVLEHDLEMTADVAFCMLVRLGDAEALRWWMTKVFNKQHVSLIIKKLHEVGWEFSWDLADSYSFGHPLKMAAMRLNYSMLHSLFHFCACSPVHGGDRDAGDLLEVIMFSAAVTPGVDSVEVAKCLTLAGYTTGEVTYTEKSDRVKIRSEAAITRSMRCIFDPHEKEGIPINIRSIRRLWSELLSERGSDFTTRTPTNKWFGEDVKARLGVRTDARYRLQVMALGSKGRSYYESDLERSMLLTSIVPRATEPPETFNEASWKRYADKSLQFWGAMADLAGLGRTDDLQNRPRDDFIQLASDIKDQFSELGLDAEVDAKLAEILERRRWRKERAQMKVTPEPARPVLRTRNRVQDSHPSPERRGEKQKQKKQKQKQAVAVAEKQASPVNVSAIVAQPAVHTPKSPTSSRARSRPKKPAFEGLPLARRQEVFDFFMERSRFHLKQEISEEHYVGSVYKSNKVLIDIVTEVNQQFPEMNDPKSKYRIAGARKKANYLTGRSLFLALHGVDQKAVLGVSSEAHRRQWEAFYDNARIRMLRPREDISGLLEERAEIDSEERYYVRELFVSVPANPSTPTVARVVERSGSRSLREQIVSPLALSPSPVSPSSPSLELLDVGGDTILESRTQRPVVIDLVSSSGTESDSSESESDDSSDSEPEEGAEVWTCHDCGRRHPRSRLECKCGHERCVECEASWRRASPLPQPQPRITEQEERTAGKKPIDDDDDDDDGESLGSDDSYTNDDYTGQYDDYENEEEEEEESMQMEEEEELEEIGDHYWTCHRCKNQGALTSVDCRQCAHIRCVYCPAI